MPALKCDACAGEIGTISTVEAFTLRDLEVKRGLGLSVVCDKCFRGLQHPTERGIRTVARKGMGQKCPTCKGFLTKQGACNKCGRGVARPMSLRGVGSRYKHASGEVPERQCSVMTTMGKRCRHRTTSATGRCLVHRKGMKQAAKPRRGMMGRRPKGHKSGCRCVVCGRM